MGFRNKVLLTNQPRSTIEINLPDGRVIEGKRGTPIGEFLQILPEFFDPPMVGAVVDGDLRELTFPLQKDAAVRPITMSDSDGSKIYRRSLTFLLETAFEDLFPEQPIAVNVKKRGQNSRTNTSPNPLFVVVPSTTRHAAPSLSSNFSVPA